MFASVCGRGDISERGEKAFVETQDLFIVMSFCILAGIWAGAFQLLLHNLTPAKSWLRLGLSAFGPGVVWMVSIFGLLAVTGSVIPDWVGMSALITGLTVFALSIVGIVLRKAMPIMSNAILFWATITSLSVCAQIVWLFVRMP